MTLTGRPAACLVTMFAIDPHRDSSCTGSPLGCKIVLPRYGRSTLGSCEQGNRPVSELPPGQRLFARYAYAPNHLGYCGPADAAALFELGCDDVSPGDPRALAPIAARFTGVWPYL